MLVYLGAFAAGFARRKKKKKSNKNEIFLVFSEEDEMLETTSLLRGLMELIRMILSSSGCFHPNVV